MAQESEIRYLNAPSIDTKKKVVSSTLTTRIPSS